MKKRSKKEKNNTNKSYTYMIVGMTVMLVVAIVTAVVFGIFIKDINSVEKISDDVIYEKHYVFVDDNTDNEFWEEVYNAASEKAVQDGIYLENIRQSLKTNYTNVDLLRVAINSKVDGIVYASGASEEIESLINNATEKGIGVVVLHNDIEKSSRQCFVGVNNYELGQIYASQIINMTGSKDISDVTITILASSDMSEGATNLVTLGIEDELVDRIDNEEEENVLPEIEIIRIDAEDTFSVEEEIRNIFVNSTQLPDIMLCLEGIYTQCVYQAVVDYNHVGDVQIIGYFSDKDILEAIDKKIIYSTVSIDTQEMGQSSIEALEEYNEIGYTNSFLPVDMQIIGNYEAHRMLTEYKGY